MDERMLAKMRETVTGLKVENGLLKLELQAIKAIRGDRADLNVLYQVAEASINKELVFNCGVFVLTQEYIKVTGYGSMDVASLCTVAERLPDVLRAIEEYKDGE